MVMVTVKGAMAVDAVALGEKVLLCSTQNFILTVDFLCLAVSDSEKHFQGSNKKRNYVFSF